MSHLHVCHSNLLKERLHFQNLTISDIPLVTKGLQEIGIHKLTQRYLLGDVDCFNLVCFMFMHGATICKRSSEKNPQALLRNNGRYSALMEDILK